eukprot:TRINITY_DN68160_c3_g2_i17.p2 TRINITY_DN68160_c3_g2~~TRINITY_DN68160_c3_g2_i17.p2  ORF type:complete len:112 (-),score=2.82 TRINITY_DN68160_c3_g2_i17:774-1109(-)
MSATHHYHCSANGLDTLPEQQLGPVAPWNAILVISMCLVRQLQHAKLGLPGTIYLLAECDSNCPTGVFQDGATVSRITVRDDLSLRLNNPNHGWDGIATGSFSPVRGYECD